MFKRKEATKAQKIFAIIYLIYQVVSMVVYLIFTYRNKFGCKGTRRIGEFNVRLNTETFDGAWTMFAQTIPTGEVTRDITVQTDLFFRLMSKKIQDCILAHECGHHLYGTPVLYGEEVSIEEEYKADRYSVEIYGKDTTIKMLRWIFAFTLNSDVLKRIKVVKAM